MRLPSSLHRWLERPATRRAFTLVEMMVVIMIIGILAALSVGVYLRQSSNAQVEATRALVRNLGDQVQLRVEAFFAANKVGSLPANAVRDLVSNDPPGIPNAARAQLVAQIDRFRTEFPQEFSDFMEDAFTDASDSPAVRHRYIEFFNSNYKFGDPTNLHVARELIPEEVRTESAECLYMILRFNNREGMTSSLDEIQRYVRDTDNDGLPEICDAWGTPIRFYRWPVDLLSYYAVIEGTIPLQSLRSNIDPNGLLIQDDWYAGSLTIVDPTAFDTMANNIGRQAFENRNADYRRPPIAAFFIRNYPPTAPAPMFVSNPVSPFTSVPARPAPTLDAQPRHRYFRIHGAYSDTSTVPITTAAGNDPNNPSGQSLGVGYYPSPGIKPVNLPPLVPCVISAGPDRDFGLLEYADMQRSEVNPTITSTGTAQPYTEPSPLSVRCARVNLRKIDKLADNLTSLKLGAVGQR